MGNDRQSKATAQGKKFIDAAREHGCDESEAEFERKLQKIAKQKPKKETPDK